MEEQTYFEYVQEKIKYIERYISLVKNGQITPELINGALAHYSGISSWLVGEYEKIVYESQIRKEEFQVEFDSWLIEASEQINKDRVQSKYAGVKEIEASARVNHRDEYLKWKRELIILDRKESLYRRLLEQWKQHGNIILGLGNNARAEMKALNIDAIMNSDDGKQNKLKKISKQL